MTRELAEVAHELLTCAEAAAYLRVHERTVARLLTRGALPGVKVGRQWRLRKADLDAYLAGARPHGRAAGDEAKARAAD